ncbi:MAG TPA: CBS domain-containing protein [Acidimicrobiales bacterium]|nr:CBS domain-containing protein [Acidimicrobiales bacterium]
MRTIQLLHRSGVGVGPERSITDVAQIMEQSGIGSVAVVDGGVLVGIVTDRDLVRRALAYELPPDARVDAVMSSPVATIDADADIHDAMDLVRSHGVRRLPVVDGGRFVGMLTIDDLLVELAADLVDLTRPIHDALGHPHRDAKVPAVR